MIYDNNFLSLHCCVINRCMIVGISRNDHVYWQHLDPRSWPASNGNDKRDHGLVLCSKYLSANFKVLMTDRAEYKTWMNSTSSWDQPTDTSGSMRNQTPYQHFAPSHVSDTSTSSSVRDLREIMLEWSGSKRANQTYGSSATLGTYESSTLDPSMESLVASQARERECQRPC